MVQDPCPWRILYIEDDEQNFISCRAMLAGVTAPEMLLERAASFDEALAKLAAQTYDVLLVGDRSDGQPAVAMIAALHAQTSTPILLLTALDDRETDRAARQAGAALCLARGEITAGLLERLIRSTIERGRIAESLADAECRLRELIQYAPAAVYEINFRTQKFTAVNDGMVELSGYSREELLEMSAFDLLDEPSQEMFRERVREWQSGTLPRETVEYVVKRKDGRRIYALLRTTFRVDQAGRPAGATVIGHDITARRLAEETFQAAAARDAFRLRLADLLHPLTDPVEIRAAAARLLGEYLQVGRAHYADILDDENTCYIYADYCRPNHRSLVGAHRFSHFGRKILAAMRAGETLVASDVKRFEGLNAHNRAAFAALGVRAFVSVPLIREGRLRASLSVNHDTARAWSEGEVALVEDTAERTWEAVERARAAAALRESEQRFRVMADGTPVMIWATDAAGKIEFINRAYMAFFGVTLEDVTTGGWQPLVHPDDAPQYVGAFIECLRKRQPFRARARVLRHDGEWRWVDSQGQPRLSSTGQFVGMVGSSPDISARVQAEREERRYAEELERTNQSLREFASIASHDLQEPLRKVQSFGRLLEEHSGDRLDEQGKDYLSRMTSAARRMAAMLQSLLDFARVSSQAGSFVETDLKLIAADVLVDLEARLLETGGQVELLDLPVIPADPLQMRQLLQNLIGNALKFHRPETPPRVTVTCRPAGDERVAILVQDNGIGFDMQKAAQIFDPFVRLHPRLSYEGTGMGLPICKKIVERHGGSISAEGEPGQGCTIRVILPVKQNRPTP